MRPHQDAVAEYARSRWRSYLPSRRATVPGRDSTTKRVGCSNGTGTGQIPSGFKRGDGRHVVGTHGRASCAAELLLLTLEGKDFYWNRTLCDRRGGQPNRVGQGETEIRQQAVRARRAAVAE